MSDRYTKKRIYDKTKRVYDLKVQQYVCVVRPGNTDRTVVVEQPDGFRYIQYKTRLEKRIRLR